MRTGAILQTTALLTVGALLGWLAASGRLTTADSQTRNIQTGRFLERYSR